MVVSTGAGISAESGLATFRDSGGLWDNYDVMEVASHEGWLRNPALIHEFYNKRRLEGAGARPNAAHRALVDLEKHFDVRVVTQNVDTLHEQAGSKEVIHLHGRMDMVEAADDPLLVWKLDDPRALTSVDTVIDGHHVRPHIVFFGEAVPMFETAATLASQADILVVIGTSLNVYPAAALLRYAPATARVFYIDPRPAANVGPRVQVIAQNATQGVVTLAHMLGVDLDGDTPNT